MFYVNREDCQYTEKSSTVYLFMSTTCLKTFFLGVGTNEEEEQCYHCDLIVFYSHLLFDTDFFLFGMVLVTFSWISC